MIFTVDDYKALPPDTRVLVDAWMEENTVPHQQVDGLVFWPRVREVWVRVIVKDQYGKVVASGQAIEKKIVKLRLRSPFPLPIVQPTTKATT